MSDAEQSSSTTSAVDRRTVVRGLAVGGVALPLLAACGGGGGGGGTPAPASSSSAAGGSSGSGSSGGTTVSTADVPEGGGKILTAQQIVVTQPTKGHFKAFSAICTHQGCPVSNIEGGEIVCNCHGSHFSITDGSPLAGPAQSALASKKVTVKGDQISVS